MYVHVRVNKKNISIKYYFLKTFPCLSLKCDIFFQLGKNQDFANKFFNIIIFSTGA